MSRSAGARLLALLLITATPGWAQQTGAEAFAAGDYAAAMTLWREEAAAGSAEAQLGLGQLFDLGLGTAPDAAVAFRWYLRAAEAGVPAAQFNVAVMLDAGTGRPRDVAAAAGWYGRAAANGHARAQYNLGLLYERGEGVDRNADLARLWLSRAAESLPAAAERLTGLAPVAPGDRRLAEPRTLTASVIAGVGVLDAGPPSGWTAIEADAASTLPQASHRRAELTWTAPPSPEGAVFFVDMVRLNEGDGAPTRFGPVALAASAVSVTVPPDGALFAWRVGQADLAAGTYTSTPWQPVRSEPAEAALPDGFVTIEVAPEDAPAARLADGFATRLAMAGIWSRIEISDAPAEVTSVRYRFAPDAALGRDVAEALPALSAADAARDDALDVAPGEVRVRLVGGLSGG